MKTTVFKSNKFAKLTVALVGMFVMSVAHSGDVGRVVNFYTTASGAVAITLDQGFPNSNATCPSAGTGAYVWGGNGAPGTSLTGALLSAKLSGMQVLVVTNGCDMGGGWVKITDVYLQ